MPNEVYVVHWPAIDVVKVGSTSARRWRKFAARGADVKALLTTATAAATYDVEDDLRSAMRHLTGRIPWAGKAESFPHLGNDGAGFMECRTIRPANLAMLEALLDAYASKQCLTAYALCRSRAMPTDERTYETPFSPRVTTGRFK